MKRETRTASPTERPGDGQVEVGARRGAVSAHRTALAYGALALLACTLPGAARAAGALDRRVSPAQLKAALIMNLLKFTEWSAPEDMSIVVCVIGDEPLAAALIDVMRTSPDGSRMQVRQPFDLTSTPECHVGFIAESPAHRAAPLLDAVRGRPILTVSDAPGFAQVGGMIELFLEEGRMRFAVNVDAAQQAHVRLSSRLLGLARIVHGDHAQ